MTTCELTLEKVKIGSIIPFKGNARKGNLDEIRKSLRINGQYRPIVVRKKNREILAGNHTWRGAKEEGWEEIWVTWIECTDLEAKRINLADNRTAELGGYDNEALAALVGELPSLEGTGWSTADLAKQLGAMPVVEQAEAAPAAGGYGHYAVVMVCGDEEQQKIVHNYMQDLVDDNLIFENIELKLVVA